MTSLIDLYLESSGAPAAAKDHFGELVATLPSLPQDPAKAASRLKNALIKKGFTYKAGTFKLHDVLREKAGNCLGFPLLIGSILAERGFNLQYRILIAPHDARHEAGLRAHQRLTEEMRYDKPSLAARQEEFPEYLFFPLEHLVLQLDGNTLFETTSEEHTAPPAESVRTITPVEALSCVYKDRAAEAYAQHQPDTARELAHRSLALWPENREAHSVLRSTAICTFDDRGLEHAVQRYRDIDGDDSLYHFSLGVFTDDPHHFDAALARYPPYAAALAWKAEKEVQTNPDPREARFLLALASHLYAQSMVTDLPRFYTTHYEALAKLFEPSSLAETLASFSCEQWGNFDYHLAFYALSRDPRHLAEAHEAVHTPHQRLVFLAASQNTKHFNPRELRALDEKHQHSRIYQQLRKDLNITNK